MELVSAPTNSSPLPGTILFLTLGQPMRLYLQRRVNSPKSVFATHYDEGRVTRSTATDPVWAELAQKSIHRYRDLERQSGRDIFAVKRYMWWFYFNNIYRVVPKDVWLTNNELKKRRTPQSLYYFTDIVIVNFVRVRQTHWSLSLRPP